MEAILETIISTGTEYVTWSCFAMMVEEDSRERRREIDRERERECVYE